MALEASLYRIAIGNILGKRRARKMVSKNSSRRPLTVIVKPLIVSFIMSKKLFNTDKIMNPILDFREIVIRLLE